MNLNPNFFIGILAAVLYTASGLEVIRIATFVPGSSPWGQVLKVWAEAVTKKSNGKLRLQFFYSSTQGDEDQMVNKMKIGQLDGALLTAVGLGRIYTPVLVLQMPGLFKNWTKLSAVRQVLDSEFQQGMNSAGFTFLGWSDFGAVHLLSRGLRVREPNDLKDKKPYIDVNNPVERAFYQVTANCTAASTSVSDILPQLNMGAIDIMLAPSLVAEQLQWSSKFNNIHLDVNCLVTGGLIIASRRFNTLRTDLRAILLDTGKVVTNALTKRIQDEDDSAFSRMKSKMSSIALTADEQSLWNTAYREVRRVLAQNVFSASLVTRVEQLAS